jgi:hypothetical protein
MTTPVSAATPTQQQPASTTFERTLAAAQQAPKPDAKRDPKPEEKPFMPSPDQLAQMGVAVMAPLFMSQVQEIIGEGLGED